MTPHKIFRGVAQLGRVLHWGCRSRKFKSCRSDKKTVIQSVLYHGFFRTLIQLLFMHGKIHQYKNCCAHYKRCCSKKQPNHRHAIHSSSHNDLLTVLSRHPLFGYCRHKSPCKITLRAAVSSRQRSVSPHWDDPACRSG